MKTEYIKNYIKNGIDIQVTLSFKITKGWEHKSDGTRLYLCGLPAYEL